MALRKLSKLIKPRSSESARECMISAKSAHLPTYMPAAHVLKPEIMFRALEPAADIGWSRPHTGDISFDVKFSASESLADCIGLAHDRCFNKVINLPTGYQIFEISAGAHNKSLYRSIVKNSAKMVNVFAVPGKTLHSWVECLA